MAWRLFSRRPLAERLDRMRRQYPFVCWLMCVLTVTDFTRFVCLGHGSVPLITFCFAFTATTWVLMSVAIVCWSAFLWARRGIRRGLPVASRRLEAPRTKGWFDYEPGREASPPMLYEARGGWRENGDFPNAACGRAERR